MRAVCDMSEAMFPISVLFIEISAIDLPFKVNFSVKITLVKAYKGLYLKYGCCRSNGILRCGS